MPDPIITPGAAGARGVIIFEKGTALFLDTPIIRKTEANVPQAMVEAWSGNFVDHIEDKWIPGWADVLESLGSFLEKLVAPAVAGYPAFVNPAFISKKGRPASQIVYAHNVNLSDSYEKIRQAVESLGTVDRDHLEVSVTASEPEYKKGEPDSLSLTGAAFELTKECSVRQWYFLNSDPRLLAALQPLDVMNGDFPPDPPFLVDGPKWDVARRHANLVVQGGVFFLNGYDMTHTHALLDEFLAAQLREDYLPPPASHIRFTTLDGVPIIRTLLAIPDA